ncbi:Endocytosis protein end4, partial [Zancudomyces culisetae]
STDLDLADAVEAAMLNAASTIEAAKAKLQAMMTVAIPNLSDAKLNINENILDYSMRLADAISRLIRAATASQNEIVAAGRGSASKTAFYKQHNRWTEGLISAAKAVAIATNILVETADAVINDTKAIEDLIVAAREVSASTVQLLAASRVKSQLHSPCQLELEAAAKAVTDTSHELVAVVSKLAEHELADQHDPERQRQVIEGWTVYEYKSKEMEQQVEILKLEKDLTNARRKLADMRRYGYHNIDDSSI